MTERITSFRVAGQTDPAIFAAEHDFEAGASSAGCFRQWVLGLTFAGACDWYAGDRPLPQSSGIVTLTRPGTQIGWRVPAGHGNWTGCYAVFHPRPHWGDWLQSHVFNSGSAVIDVSHDPASRARVERQFKLVCRVYGGGLVDRDDWSLLALERVLLTIRNLTREQAYGADARISAAVRYLHANYKRPLTNREVARAVHLSNSHFSHLFSEQIGVSPMQYLERLRLQQAASLLTFTSSPIAQVARSVGYDDAEYFGRRFQRFAGQTPRAYRVSSHFGGSPTKP